MSSRFSRGWFLGGLPGLFTFVLVLASAVTGALSAADLPTRGEDVLVLEQTGTGLASRPGRLRPQSDASWPYRLDYLVQAERRVSDVRLSEVGVALELLRAGMVWVERPGGGNHALPLKLAVEKRDHSLELKMAVRNLDGRPFVEYTPLNKLRAAPGVSIEPVWVGERTAWKNVKVFSRNRHSWFNPRVQSGGWLFLESGPPSFREPSPGLSLYYESRNIAGEIRFATAELDRRAVTDAFATMRLEGPLSIEHPTTGYLVQGELEQVVVDLDEPRAPRVLLEVRVKGFTDARIYVPPQAVKGWVQSFCSAYLVPK